MFNYFSSSGSFYRGLPKMQKFQKLKLSLQYSIVNFKTRLSYCTVNIESLSEWCAAKPFNEIPSMTCFPVIGTAWQYMPIIGRFSLDRQHIANHEKRKMFGDVFREKFGPMNIVLSFRPQDLAVVFKNEGRYPFRSEFESLKAYRELRRKWYSTNGLLALNGKEWHNLRYKTQRYILRPDASSCYACDMQTIAKDFVKSFHKKKTSSHEIPDLMHEIYKWSLESIAFVGLDTRLGCLESDVSPESDGIRMINSVLTQFGCMSRLEAFSGNVQFWKLFSTPTWKKFVKASDVYTEISFKHLSKALEKSKKINSNDEQRLTFLQNLFREGLDPSSIMVMVSDMVMAGIETTSHAAGFLLYHLAINPEKQASLYEEVKRLLPSDDDKITPNVFDNMKYVKACLKESLRLKPVVGGAARVMDKDVVIGGYQVPKGTLVAIGYQELFNDEKYIPSPEKYVPERWLNRSDSNHRYVLPFGAGVRGCIGKRIAQLEIYCLMIEIIRKYELKYEGEDIGIITKMVSMPDKPLKIKFIKR